MSIEKRAESIMVCLANVYNTGGVIQKDDYIFINKQIEGIKKEAADVRLVKYGKWLHDRRTQWKCSICGNFLDFDGLNCGRGSAFYCPNCGTDMRGEQNDN